MLFSHLFISGIVLSLVSVILIHFFYPRRSADSTKNQAIPAPVSTTVSLPWWFRAFRGLVILAAVVCFVILAVTGFYPGIINGQKLTGYPLMLHAAVSPVFAMCLALLAVFSAKAHACDPNTNACCSGNAPTPPTNTVSAIAPTGKKICTGQKICFWLILIIALPLMLSIALSMLPLFGTDSQHFFYQVHRYCALLLTVLVIPFAYGWFIAKFEK